ATVHRRVSWPAPRGAPATFCLSDPRDDQHQRRGAHRRFKMIMLPTSGDYASDLRAQIERRRLEAEQLRQQALLDQRAFDSPPDARVRVWERLHQLRLPKDPLHAVLNQVAAQTGLALSDVQEVQRQRALAR